MGIGKSFYEGNMADFKAFENEPYYPQVKREKRCSYKPPQIIWAII